MVFSWPIKKNDEQKKLTNGIENFVLLIPIVFKPEIYIHLKEYDILLN